LLGKDADIIVKTSSVEMEKEDNEQPTSQVIFISLALNSPIIKLW